jgi:hypothetical protein
VTVELTGIENGGYVVVTRLVTLVMVVDFSGTGEVGLLPVGVVCFEEQGRLTTEVDVTTKTETDV